MGFPPVTSDMCVVQLSYVMMMSVPLPPRRFQGGGVRSYVYVRFGLIQVDVELYTNVMDHVCMLAVVAMIE